MDLKDFIKTSIKDIATASHELQAELAGIDVVVNPPVSAARQDIFEDGNAVCSWRQIRDVEFDVAVADSSTSSGSGAVKVLFVKVDGGMDAALETSSRLRFSIPIGLPASQSGKKNLEALQTKLASDNEMISKHNKRKSAAYN